MGALLRTIAAAVRYFWESIRGLSGTRRRETAESSSSGATTHADVNEVYADEPTGVPSVGSDNTSLTNASAETALGAERTANGQNNAGGDPIKSSHRNGTTQDGTDWREAGSESVTKPDGDSLVLANDITDQASARDAGNAGEPEEKLTSSTLRNFGQPDEGTIAGNRARAVRPSGSSGQTENNSAKKRQNLVDDSNAAVDDINRENPTTADELTRPCPRCGVTCSPAEVDRVFGYRTMRWTTASGLESKALHRQSYCRRCRAEHAAEIRGRFDDPTGSFPESKVSGAGETGEEHPIEQDVDAITDADTSVVQSKEDANAAPEDRERNDALSSNGSTGDADNALSNFSPDIEDEPLELPRHRKGTRRPQKYRAPAGGPSPARPRAQGEPSQNDAEPSGVRDRRAPVEVRVLFERGGYCNVTLLVQRPPGLPEELTVFGDLGDVELVALEEQWYQDVVPNNLAQHLHRGFIWTDEGTGQEWVLSGREVFVLAPGTAHRGYVSCSRLVLGREHVVLCSNTQLGAVEGVLREAGCPAWTQLGDADGVPQGWVVLRGIVPQRSVLPSTDAEILNVLRPLPEIEIALEEGIRLAYNSWLLGHPPTVRVYGNLEHTEQVLIDGQEAIGSNDRGYTAPGWDQEGDHGIWCSNASKSYSLVRCEANWSFWPAYSFALPDSTGENRQFEFCGPIVRASDVRGGNDCEPGQHGAIEIPIRNPVLLGNHPGQVFVAHRRRDVDAAVCLASPPFHPVWALPAQPLQCDKRTNRILLLGELVAVSGNKGDRQPRKSNHILNRWCRLILDCSRKGLGIAPANQETYKLWRDYNHYARRLWRELR